MKYRIACLALTFSIAFSCHLLPSHPSNRMPREVRQWISCVQRGDMQTALSILHSLKDTSVRGGDAPSPKEVAAALHEMLSLEAGAVTTIVQQVVSECTTLLAQLAEHAGGLNDTVLSRVTSMLLLAMSLVVMHASENISLHIAHD